MLINVILIIVVLLGAGALIMRSINKRKEENKRALRKINEKSLFANDRLFFIEETLDKSI